MAWRRILLVLLVQAGLAVPVQAGIFFTTKRDKVPPAQRVQDLIATLKNDSNDGKRAAAAEEMRQFDPKTFPEVVPVLIDVVQHDAKPDVRTQAVQTLGKMRPVSQEIGAVIEQAASGDSSIRVRIHARNVLFQYQLAGYRSGKGDAHPQKGITTDEPPLYDPQQPQMPPGSVKQEPGKPSVIVPVFKSKQGAPTARPVNRTTPEVQGPELTAPK